MVQSENLISVLMGVYNEEAHIVPAVKSILNQTYRNFELLIVDDGSTDRTPELLDRLAATDSRVKVLHESNKGLTKSLNQLFALSRGSMIARMDADDVAYPTRFELQMQYLLRHPQVGVLSSWSNLMTDAGNCTVCYCYPDNHDWVLKCFQTGYNPITHAATMIRRTLLENLDGPYRFKYSQDLDLWLRLRSYTKFGIVQRFLLASRNHANRLSAQNLEMRRQLDDLIRKVNNDPGQNGAEWDWMAEEARIVAAMKASATTVEQRAHQSYIEALALEAQHAEPGLIRQHLRASMQKPDLRGKALIRYLFTWLPRGWLSWVLGLAPDRRLIWQHHHALKDVVSPEEYEQLTSYWKQLNNYQSEP